MRRVLPMLASCSPYLKRTGSMPSPANIALVVVWRIPTNATQVAGSTNPLVAETNSFGSIIGWAAVS